MVTYAQLGAEPYWNRERAPDSLVRLGRRLCAAHKRPTNAFGIKGDNAHLNGSHRSQEWIKKSKYCTNRTYTVQAGLNATQELYICGFDYNPGSERLMIELCRRLDREVRAGRLEIVREWYGNDDGDNRVDGYNNVANKIASSDASHLWHIHLTCDRRRLQDDAAINHIGDVLLGEEQDVATAKENWEYQIKNPDSGNEASAEWRLLDIEKMLSSRVLPALTVIKAAMSNDSPLTEEDIRDVMAEELQNHTQSLLASLGPQLIEQFRAALPDVSEARISSMVETGLRNVLVEGVGIVPPNVTG